MQKLSGMNVPPDDCEEIASILSGKNGKCPGLIKIKASSGKMYLLQLAQENGGLPIGIEQISEETYDSGKFP